MSKKTHKDNQQKTENNDPETEAEQLSDDFDAGIDSIGVEDDLPLEEAQQDGLEQVLAQLAEAELAAEQAKDDLLRVQAEMQNLRRRTEQDVEKAHKYGQERFSIELLGVMDNLERTLLSVTDSEAGSENSAVKAILEGVDLTLKSFSDCFTKFNIEVVDPMGEPFDPQLHQAMSMQDNPDVEPNTVIAVMQKGYTLHGRVIRPAMVMVSKGSSPTIDEKA